MNESFFLNVYINPSTSFCQTKWLQLGHNYLHLILFCLRQFFSFFIKTIPIFKQLIFNFGGEMRELDVNIFEGNFAVISSLLDDHSMLTLTNIPVTGKNK